MDSSASKMKNRPKKQLNLQKIINKSLQSNLNQKKLEAYKILSIMSMSRIFLLIGVMLRLRTYSKNLAISNLWLFGKMISDNLVLFALMILIKQISDMGLGVLKLLLKS